MGLFGSLSPDTQAMLGRAHFGSGSDGNSPYEMSLSGGSPQSIAPQPVSLPQGMFGSAPTVKPPQPGFNAPGGWAEKLGRIGAILMSSAGDQAGRSLMEDQSNTRLQMLRHQQALEDYRNQSLAALQREQAIYDYKLAHPEPTDLQRYAAEAGIKPGTPEYTELMKAGAWDKAMPPHMVTDPTTGEVKMVGGYVPQATSGPPPAAVDALRRNPALAKDFDAKYGAGMSGRYLQGGATGAPSRPF